MYHFSYKRFMNISSIKIILLYVFIPASLLHGTNLEQPSLSPAYTKERDQTQLEEETQKVSLKQCIISSAKYGATAGGVIGLIATTGIFVKFNLLPRLLSSNNSTIDQFPWEIGAVGFGGALCGGIIGAKAGFWKYVITKIINISTTT